MSRLALTEVKLFPVVTKEPDRCFPTARQNRSDWAYQWGVGKFLLQHSGINEDKACWLVAGEITGKLILSQIRLERKKKRTFALAPRISISSHLSAHHLIPYFPSPHERIPVEEPSLWNSQSVFVYVRRSHVSGITSFISLLWTPFLARPGGIQRQIPPLTSHFHSCTRLTTRKHTRVSNGEENDRATR